MGKTASPAKRTPPSGASSVDANVANGAADEVQLTARAERVESTIVSRENATHAAFAASRSRAFPYAPTSHYLHLLHDYCNSVDVSTAHGASPLLVVVGPPGTGKSSLLAHWAATRRASEDSSHEFIYEHYCGCSFDSVKLSLFLFRLMNQLKLTFALRDFELPHEHEEEKLKFSFARCLEAAVGRTNQRSGGAGPSSKRRTVILLLDGIDCIRTEDGGDSLSWLPNSFPPGVRIIVSANHAGVGKHALASARAITRKPVVYDSDGDLIYDTSLPPSDCDSHTIRELRRRQVSFVAVEPLDESSCRAILQLYNASVAAPLSSDEQDAVVAAPGSANPLYLRLLLQGQELFKHGSPSRAVWFERATRTSEIHGLYELLVRRWNEILLEDLYEQLHKLTGSPDGETEANTSAPPSKLTRRPTKRDVTTEAAHGSHQLTKGTSVRSINHSTPTPESAELENLRVAMEQRVLLVRHTLSLLAVCRYGLSEADLTRLLGDTVPRAICQKLLSLLSPHMMQIRRHDCGPEVVLLDLNHNQLRLLVRYGFLKDDHLRSCYYKELATYFGGLEASQRRIDELPVQLERCGMWLALEAALVDIKMFQLWWSERNRQEFFSYWMVLRSNCSIHDPVDDFIRSLDEFIVHENPSAEQLLALCLPITDFLRAWQRIDDSRSGQLTLARPAPPQLNEFIASVSGFFSTTHMSEHESKRMQLEIDALCIHKSDAYFVRRWLWTQFPLVAVAFECRFLKSLLASSKASSATTEALKDDDAVSDSNSHNTDGSVKSSTSGGTKKAVVLPKSLVGGTSHSPLKTAKRKPSLLFGNNNSPCSSDRLDDGAFEFLSTENTELTVGSVSKFEAQLVELRMRYDKLKFTAKAKRDALKTLDSRLLEVRAQARAAGQNATQVEALLDHIREIGSETVVGRQRGDYYKAILRHCEIHPARDPNAIEVTETAVNKMKQEIVELQQKTQVVAYEARLASIESKKLHDVIADKTQIHNTALERLRWRLELLQRMMVQQRRAAAGGRADAIAAVATDDDSEADEDEEGTEEDEAEDEVEDDEETLDGNNNATATGSSKRQRKPSTVVDEQAMQFNRAKDKLLHKKETTLERLRKVESLKVYLGSPYKDDGVLGALRQVGINKPEEAQLYWQDQQQHAAQLETEEKSLEQRVSDYRDRLASLQAQLQNLKLGGSASASGGDTTNTSIAAASSGDAPVAPADSTILCSSAASSSSSHNLKQLEQQLGDALGVLQQKKERAARVKSLAERLHLGLQHVAQLFGVNTTQQIESIELADAVEQVVRLYLGDEGHLQSGSSTNLRRKNSVRATAQGGLHAITAPDARSPDEKLRFNLRVSKSPQRQMNPYVDGDGDAQDDDNDDDDDPPDDDVDDGRPVDAVDAVTRRDDIKNRARTEVERKLRTPAATKAPRDKPAKAAKTRKGA